MVRAIACRDRELSGGLRAGLDEALLSLPAKYRDAVVLACLERRDRADAAAELGISCPAFSRRLERGLEKLRLRMAGGAALSSAALAALLASEAASGAGGAELVLSSMAGNVAAADSLAWGEAASLAKKTEGVMLMSRIKIALVSIVGCAMLAGGGLAVTQLSAAEGKGAGKDAKKLVVKPELRPDPAVLKILNGLGNNQSAWLPAKNVVGKFNAFLKQKGMDKRGPGPRDYCLKWVWAADRKRALFCGGNAGVPHKLNDVWEYDLASNTWVLLWEPDPDTNRIRHMKNEEAKEYMKFVKVDRETGEIMTQRGAPFDPVHTWWGLTYDPKVHALLWVMGNHHLHQKFLSLYPDQAKLYKMGGFHKMRLWAFFPYEQRWQMFKPPSGLRKSPAAILEYIPEMGGDYYLTATHLQGGVFKSETREWEWKKVARSKKDWRDRQLPEREAVAAYDSTRKILVAHYGGHNPQDPPVTKQTYHYSVDSGKWERVLSTKEAPPGYDGVSPMTYDSVAGRCYISINVSDRDARRRKYSTKLNGLWAYDSGAKKWTCLKPDGPASPRGLACYNPEYNVLMIDSGGGKVWVYRGKKR